MAATFTTPTKVNNSTSGKLEAFEFTVTSDTDGSGTSGYTIGPLNGFVWCVDTDPDATDVPTDNWDLYLENSMGIDVAGGACINRDTSTSERAYPTTGNNAPPPEVGFLRARVANMGSGKKATIRVYHMPR